MSEPTTLDTMEELRDCEFGRPKPRHGLKLLHWFAKKCISFINNNDIKLKCKPENGDYGFHEFHNKLEMNGKQFCNLLPKVKTPTKYYEVGNLSNPGNLPGYVLEDYHRYSENANKDRIIIRYNAGSVSNVYITEHYEHTNNFDPEKTYQINKRLLQQIRNLTRNDFLNKAGYSTQSNTSNTFEIQMQPTSNNRPAETWIDMEPSVSVPVTVNDHEVYNRCSCVIL